MAANEATCLLLAGACGLTVPPIELLEIGGVPVLAISRYDRRESAAGQFAIRLHQEDGCQATAKPPGQKYEEQGGPSLRELARMLRNFGEPADVTSLLRRTTFNLAVGNADAHAKNFSILQEPDGPAIGLAPLYDVVSTIALELTDAAGLPMRADTHLGQRVGGRVEIGAVTKANLLDEATSWGIGPALASGVVTETLEQVIRARSGLCASRRRTVTLANVPNKRRIRR